MLGIYRWHLGAIVAGVGVTAVAAMLFLYKARLCHVLYMSSVNFYC